MREGEWGGLDKIECVAAAHVPAGFLEAAPVAGDCGMWLKHAHLVRLCPIAKHLQRTSFASYDLSQRTLVTLYSLFVQIISPNCDSPHMKLPI